MNCERMSKTSNPLRFPDGMRLGNENRSRVAPSGVAARAAGLFVGAGRSGAACGAQGAAVSSVMRTASHREPIAPGRFGCGDVVRHPHLWGGTATCGISFRVAARPVSSPPRWVGVGRQGRRGDEEGGGGSGLLPSPFALRGLGVIRGERSISCSGCAIRFINAGSEQGLAMIS